MDRCAVFVDAGHLLAEGGKLCCGTRRRNAFRCDYAGMTAALTQFASNHCQLPLLRTYWYDAAPDAIPTKEHLGIAELANVKLRLGRLVGAQQKGVDSLIDGERARLVGRDVAIYWAKRATEDEVQRLLAQAPIIPRELDVEIVVEAERSLGSLKTRRDLKQDLRAGFWSALMDSIEPAAT